METKIKTKMKVWVNVYYFPYESEILYFSKSYKSEEEALLSIRPTMLRANRYIKTIEIEYFPGYKSVPPGQGAEGVD